MLKNHFVNSPVVCILKKKKKNIYIYIYILLQHEGVNGDNHLAPKVNFQD